MHTIPSLSLFRNYSNCLCTSVYYLRKKLETDWLTWCKALLFSNQEKDPLHLSSRQLQLWQWHSSLVCNTLQLRNIFQFRNIRPLHMNFYVNEQEGGEEARRPQ